MRRFQVSFATFAELTNDERTRTFLSLEVGAGHHEVRRYLQWRQSDPKLKYVVVVAEELAICTGPDPSVHAPTGFLQPTKVPHFDSVGSS